MSNRIAEIRRSKGVNSREALADLAGCHWMTIAKLERGEMNLTQHWMERIAKALNCKPHEFLPEAVAVSQWQEISTAPKDDEFLAYGFYVYPGDTSRTEYQYIAWRSGSAEWPWETLEGRHRAGFFTHWMPLPAPPIPHRAESGQ